MANSIQIQDNLMQDFPLISVIILNYNGLRYLKGGLKECLDSVVETDYPNLEVIFVDNGSKDKSADFVRENFKERKIKVIENKHNLGFSEGFNKGIKVSHGKYIALLSNDMTVDPGWLRPVIKLMETEPKIGLAGFKRLVYGTKNLLDGIGGDLHLCGRARPVGAYEIDRGQYDTVREDLDYIGGAMVLRRKTLQEVGLFDPAYIIFSEDLDLCYRIRKRGYKTIYVPDAIIYHRGQATLKAMDPKGRHIEYMAHRSRIRCILIHFTLIRLLSAFVIDLVSLFFVTNPTTKRLLLKAYLSNLKNIGTTLKRRRRYGPSPPFRCKFPVIARRQRFTENSREFIKVFNEYEENQILKPQRRRKSAQSCVRLSQKDHQQDNPALVHN